MNLEYQTDGHKAQTKPQTTTNTVLNQEYQTDSQMATKPNTTRLNLRQSQTHGVEPGVSD